MLKLIDPPATVTVTMRSLPGVALECRPPTTALVEQARSEARRQAGGDDDGAIEEAYTLALLKAAVVSWTGVGDKDGKPVAVNDETLAAFGRLHPVGILWRSAYLASAIERALEGEDCAPAPHGTTAGAPATADAAAA